MEIDGEYCKLNLRLFYKSSENRIPINFDFTKLSKKELELDNNRSQIPKWIIKPTNKAYDISLCWRKFIAAEVMSSRLTTI